jgi:hypothetical protein
VKPGEMIEVEFERAGEPMSGEIETILAPGEDPPRTIIGFRPIDTTTVELPEGTRREHRLRQDRWPVRRVSPSR